MLKHGKYSKTKEVNPYVVVETIIRSDGKSMNDHYFSTLESAQNYVRIKKQIRENVAPNEYYKGCTYEIKFIGYDKYINGGR